MSDLQQYMLFVDNDNTAALAITQQTAQGMTSKMNILNQALQNYRSGVKSSNFDQYRPIIRGIYQR